MCDLHWCVSCDKAIDSDSLYCSNECLMADAMRHHPVYGTPCPECLAFCRSHARPRRRSSFALAFAPCASPVTSNASTTSSPLLLGSPWPSPPNATPSPLAKDAFTASNSHCQTCTHRNQSSSIPRPILMEATPWMHSYS
ncbi:hypothetical protein BC940DRAFT_282129 [Gongronella butleri]|nr:hypothetical protein BC940DRAFT_282129 [Gongronella butleri]